MDGQKTGSRDVIRIDFEMHKIYKRFTTGKLGERLKGLLDSLEFRSYFKKNLVDWAKEQASKISDIESRQEFEKENTEEILMTEVRFNITVDVFWKAVEYWLKNGGNMDEIAMEMLNLETMKNVVFLLQKIKENELEEIIHFEDEETQRLIHGGSNEQPEYVTQDDSIEEDGDKSESGLTFDIFGHVTKKEWLN